MINKKLLIEQWKKIDKNKINQWETIHRKINPKYIPKVTNEGTVVCPLCGAKAILSSKTTIDYNKSFWFTFKKDMFTEEDFISSPEEPIEMTWEQVERLVKDGILEVEFK